MIHCLVCETEANGMHFGIKCCRACAAFFRRTLSMNLKYKCRFDRKCEVSFNKRYSCRSCRFEKCLQVGMRKDMVQGKSDTERDFSDDEGVSTNSSPDSSLESVPYINSFDKLQNNVVENTNGTGFLLYENLSKQPNILFHKSVIEEVGRAMLPSQETIVAPDYSYLDLSGTDECTRTTSNSLTDSESPTISPSFVGDNRQLFTMAAQQATQDLYANVQQFLTPRIDAMFCQDAETFCSVMDIPLTLCQQALLAYREHNKKWPDQNNCIENVPLDMEIFMRNHYIEIEHIACFCMSIRAFAQLPKDQKWIIFKHFWTRFFELDRCFATCQRLGYSLDDERMLTLNGQIINFGISVVKLENISDLDANQVKNFLKGSVDKFRLIFINPFKKLQPTEYELMYMMMSIMWCVNSLPGITPTTRDIAEKVELRLAEDLHTYYSEQYDNNYPNYAGRITRLSSIASAVDEITERKREDCQVSKTFNIFKNDFFFSDLTDFPV